MAGQRQVLLHLVELGRHDHAERVLLAVDRALLQRGEDLGEGHRRGDDAEALVGGHVHRVLHRAHLQALQVVGAVHRTLAVGHVAHAVLAPGQRLEALGLELLQHLLADGAVEHRACVGLVAEQERDVEDACLGHEVGHRAGAGEGELLRAQLHRFDALALAAQAAGIEGLHLVAAAGALFDLAGEDVDAHALVGVLGHRDADLHGGLGQGRGGDEGERGQGGGKQGQALHGDVSNGVMSAVARF